SQLGLALLAELEAAAKLFPHIVDRDVSGKLSGRYMDRRRWRRHEDSRRRGRWRGSSIEEKSHVTEADIRQLLAMVKKGELRARHERPRCRAADKRDELAPSHSITSSARARSVGGTVSPSMRAVG